MISNFSQYSAYLFDLDGCIYSGNRIYPGSKDLLVFLIRNEKKIYFLSNNSNETSHSVRTKLLNMGLPANNLPILVATELIGQYLNEKYGKVKVYPVGSIEMENSLKSYGHAIYPIDGEELCDFVIIGRDTSFNYHKLRHCVRALMGGAKLIAANPDMYHPAEDGTRMPETGALVAAIQAVSGIYELESVGKPHFYPFRKAIEELGLAPQMCVMIGDNPYTDIKGGRDAGMHTIWLSHGKTFPEELGFQPDLTVINIEEMLRTLEKNHSLLN